ncbi:MAG: GNAT family N-acetyltransferase, partial [Flavobacteriaceae bacterium]
MKVVIANSSHIKYAEIICETIKESAKVRGTGIAERTPEY